MKYLGQTKPQLEIYNLRSKPNCLKKHFLLKANLSFTDLGLKILSWPNLMLLGQVLDKKNWVPWNLKDMEGFGNKLFHLIIENYTSESV